MSDAHVPQHAPIPFHSPVSISSVTVTTIPNDTLYVDTFSDFMCNTTLSEYVDTSTTIMYQWLGPSLLTTGADYNITGDTASIGSMHHVIMAGPSPARLTGQQYVLQNTRNNETRSER